MLDILKKLFTGKPNAAMLESAAKEVKTALDDAERVLAERSKSHNSQVLELVAAGNDKLLAKSRAEVSDAEARVADLRVALSSVTAQLHMARTADQRSRDSDAWAEADELLKRRSAAISRFQKAVDQMALEQNAVLELTEQAWQAIPVKLGYRPKTFTAADFHARANHYIFGVTDGKMGSGVNAYVARTAPDLVALGEEARTMILAARTTEAQVAA